MTTGKTLQPGRYWADVFPKHKDAWEWWLFTNAGFVTIERYEIYPERTWYLVKLNRETLYPLGTKTAPISPAGDDVLTSDDTVKRPDEQTSGDLLEELTGGAKQALTVVVGLGAALLLVNLLTALRGRR